MNRFWLSVIVLSLLGPACEQAPDPRRSGFRVDRQGISARYDEKTGRLKRIDMDQNKNGRIDTFSYWDGPRIDRVEVDHDENGVIDRWEHYGPDNKMGKVGTSSRGDGFEDLWSFVGADGLLEKIESDTNRDGIVDKRETYGPGAGGRQARVVAMVELELDKSGNPSRRLYYRPDGSFDRLERVRPE